MLHQSTTFGKSAAAGLAKPLAIAGAGILATPTATADGTLTGAQRRELDQEEERIKQDGTCILINKNIL